MAHIYFLKASVVMAEVKPVLVDRFYSWVYHRSESDLLELDLLVRQGSDLNEAPLSTAPFSIY